MSGDLPATLERPHVFVPAEPGAAGPPLLLLHGTGGSEHDLVPLRNLLSPGAAVLSPRGMVLEGGMSRFFRRLAEGVFDEDDLSRRADELADFVTAASSAYSIATGTLVAVGFSNGSNIASAMLLGHPRLLRGALLVAAMVPYASPPTVDLSGVDVLVSNGERDPMIPASMTAELGRQLRERGAHVTDLPHGGGHQLDPGSLRRAAKLLGSLARP
ncbi:alpha/beta hydrolase [uncultured Friedmanniella sp.]|uniref:alpha/beta hydrolase n=1 Tax=uncultured Friedmanniella sp. TaxID=335381 RepID=UPI0035CC45D2